jgi:hypothetical protein
MDHRDLPLQHPDAGQHVPAVGDLAGPGGLVAVAASQSRASSTDINRIELVFDMRLFSPAFPISAREIGEFPGLFTGGRAP